MELRDRTAVVTGGASGIGRALAERLAADGARVAIADLDRDGAEAAAAGIGRETIGLACDVTAEDQVRDLIATVERDLGPIDLFCANAGVGTGTGLDTPDEVWDGVLAVNLRAHVIAARQLVPRWLERGGGYFVATASAAGLLTQIGDAPYSVSKHAAVAFAEWLSVTYGDRGVGVSCLCPMGVETPLLRGGLEAGGPEALGVRAVEAAGRILTPAEVAEHVVEAIAAERFLILPHPEVHVFLRRKADDPDRWLAGMRRLKSQLER